MKTKTINLKLFVILISFALIIPLYLISVQAQKQKKPANADQKNPVTKIYYKNYIWIEGENSVDTNFSKEKFVSTQVCTFYPDIIFVIYFGNGFFLIRVRRFSAFVPEHLLNKAG